MAFMGGSEEWQSGRGAGLDVVRGIVSHRADDDGLHLVGRGSEVIFTAPGGCEGEDGEDRE